MPLEKIPKEFLWDYIRGLMDGDGCITILSNRIYNPFAISFTSGNKECVEQMKTIWNIDNTISDIHGSFIIQKSGSGCIPILEKMY